MAKPITAIQKRQMTEEEKRAEALAKLKAAVGDSEEAVRELLTLIEQLHESGLLEAANALLKAREDVAKIVVGQLNQKPVTTMVNHAFALAGLAASLDPERTAKLLEHIASGAIEAYEETSVEPKKVGLFDLFKALNDPDINRAVHFFLSALKAIGQRLRNDS
ncbi:hypothetical protein GS3922_13395 [Geobacillus subterraneus]|uniref:DUF1641 domain-containing protein n=2 Tax=Geobacillus TaxID=129337 RepID=A0ABN4NJ71_9BACL|nr:MULTISPECIES: DUF1641 domain-containing protein [Geobacillus]AMX84557.1 hypothetical protein GS3922_13395 [Geobacillus subterraneus]KZS24962.1 hypothetical protein A5418_04860 [Geobacillus subterraneus]OXB87597.1 hypothetical protein B9L21_13435 [Geobacillus uzenensis]WPZ18846.1 DUF1641 domain-containing protein [Geobacillus subterraneus]